MPKLSTRPPITRPGRSNTLIAHVLRRAAHALGFVTCAASTLCARRKITWQDRQNAPNQPVMRPLRSRLVRGSTHRLFGAV